MTRWGMVIDLARCVGCNACTVACKIENGTPPDHYWARVYTEETGTFPDVKTTYVPALCNHCADAPCVTVCPTGASHQRDDGIVLVNQDTCIGCRACMMACPILAASLLMAGCVVPPVASPQGPTAEEDLIDRRLQINELGAILEGLTDRSMQSSGPP